MKMNMRRIFAVMLALVLLFSNTSVAFAAPSRPGEGSSDVYDHIDVRQEGPSIEMTYVTKNLVTGQVVSTKTVTIDCTVTAITSVSYQDASGYSNTWTSGFTNDGRGYEFRQMNLSLSKDLTGSYATIIVDLTDTDGNVYEDVVFTFGPSGCQQAVYDCDGYGSSGGNGRGSVGLDFILGVNNNASIVYTDWVIPVNKVWNDDNDRDDVRPDSVTIELLANGVVVDSAVLSDANGWYFEFTDKDAADASGNLITYTIRESSVPAGYTASVENFTVTNTHVLETTSVSGSKTWADNDDQDGMRPDSVTVELYANGVATGKTATVTEEDNWTWTFTDLLKNASGEPIVYTVREVNVADGYVEVPNGMNITNTHTPIQIDLTVTKIWDDANNQDDIRPDSIVVELYANGEPTGKTLTITGDTWTGTFTGLDMYANGKEIVYTVEEVDVPKDYTAEVTKEGFAFTVTNTHNVYKKDITVTKAWNDKDNQDGIRPGSITVNLLADGAVIETVELNAANNWSYTFRGLDVNKAGKAISYTVEEVKVPDGYTASVSGLTITNTHTTATVDVPVSKVWNDNDNQDGKRPVSITVKLLADGVDTGKTLTLNSGNNWAGTFTGLDKFAPGKVGAEVKYTVQEVMDANADAAYTTEITVGENGGFVITNTHEIEKTSVSGAKTWNDNNDQDGKRPESITIRLLANGIEVDSVVVTEDNNWAWSFTDLDKYSGGEPINYIITEDAIEGYTAEVKGFNVINTHNPEKVNIAVTKVWDDNDNQDGKRPSSVTINLLANGEPTGETLKLSEENKWTGSFTNLDKYVGGVEITYTVTEDEVAEYEVAIKAAENDPYRFTVTNSHEIELTSVSGSKTWDDADNQDGKRPTSITINLLANGEKVASQEVKADAEGNWTWTFDNLPKYKGGVEISYTITENEVTGYTTKVEGFNVTNTYAPEKTSVTVVKAWNDNNNQDGFRPENITVKLLANGNVLKNAILNEKNNWTYSFDNLDKYAKGQEIEYTIEEVAVDKYATEIVADEENPHNFTITNTHEPEKVSFSGMKTWNDNNNQDGKRPESITITLKANGEIVETATVTAANEWAWSFTGLNKYAAGVEIVYTITEGEVEDYTAEINGFDVTNTHAPEKTSVNVTKVWNDNNNQDGIRTNDVTVILWANGEKTDKTVTLSEGNSWSATFTDLDKYAEGEEIVYTVTEVEIEGYEAQIQTEADNEHNITITNYHTPETISISGSKTWDDNEDQDGFRPESITIRLMANGKEVASAVVTEAEEWAWTFENLPKFEAGEEIVYAVTEDAVENYSAEYAGFNVTNTHTPEQTSITVTKAWEDKDDQDGIRPDEITVILLANGEETGVELVLDQENNWTGSFTELDVYADGEKITYTVQEIKTDGYETTITGDAVKGFVITNCHTPETISVSGAKTWDDNENQDGKRPESITINLMANGKEVAELVVTEKDEWTWTFENLPKYENGVEIVYAVTEDAVDGYTITYDGYNITNSYTPAQTSVTVTKAWADSNDEDGLRPKKITITLYANGELTNMTLVLTADSNWSGSFVGLPKYAGGKEIVYTVGEVAVKGYNTVIRGSMEKGFVVTNSHTVIPQTGDERTPVLWGLLMLASVAAVAYVYGDTKKRRMNNK